MFLTRTLLTLTSFFFHFFIQVLPRVECALSGDYTAMSASDKQNILWKKIVDTTYDQDKLPTKDYNMANMTKLFSPQFDAVSFLHMGDEMPGKRQRLVHTYGSVCKIQLKITSSESPFTGVFQSGGLGLLRISPATQDKMTITPGLGVKILIDGKNSQNFLLLNSRTGQGKNGNYFSLPMRNIIPQPDPATPFDQPFEAAIGTLPGKPIDNPESGLNMGLFEQAAMTSDGKKVSKVVAPYMVTFTPNPAIGWDETDSNDYRVNLAGVPEGSLLYTVTAKRTMDSEDVAVGELISMSPFVASVYGDQTLFFNHARKQWQAA